MQNIRLPLIVAKSRGRALIWGALCFALGYLLLGACPLGEPSHLPLTPVDRMIPLMPWTLLIYISDYGFIVMALTSLREAEEFTLAYYRLIAGMLMSFCVFLVFPTVYPRPLMPDDAFLSAIFRCLHFVDRPTNCFPSLHVSMTLLAAASIQSWTRWRRIGAYIWAAAICLSTLTTKQHYVLDVIGGIFVTLASIRLTARVGLRRDP